MPYKSRAQQRYMHAAAARSEISKETVEEFDHATKDFSTLPERVERKRKRKKEAFDLGVQAALKRLGL